MNSKKAIGRGIAVETAIVTESNNGIFETEGKDLGVFVVPMPVQFDEITYYEGKNITYEELVYIPMSSGLSGSCETALGLAQEYEGKVQVVDNHRVSVTQRHAVLDALSLRAAGYTAA